MLHIWKLSAIVMTMSAMAGCAREPSPSDEPKQSTGAPAPIQAPATLATAELKNAAGDVIGTATFTGADTVATLRVVARTLTPGLHGIHIHERGTCTAPTFESAGSHLNPVAKQHGLENPAGPHAGDLPNLTVNDSGMADTSFAVPAPLLASDSPLFAAGGAALVIHLKRDDQRTDPSGNSGDRIACGVIERRTM